MKHQLTRAALALGLSAGLLAGAATAEAVKPVTPKPGQYLADPQDIAQHGSKVKLTIDPGGRVTELSVWAAYGNPDQGTEEVFTAQPQDLRAVNGRIAGSVPYVDPFIGTRETAAVSLRVVNRELVVGVVHWRSEGGARHTSVVSGTQRTWDVRTSQTRIANWLLKCADEVPGAMRRYEERNGFYPRSVKSARWALRLYSSCGAGNAKDGTVTSLTRTRSGHSLRFTSSRTPVYFKQSDGGRAVLAVR